MDEICDDMFESEWDSHPKAPDRVNINICNSNNAVLKFLRIGQTSSRD